MKLYALLVLALAAMLAGDIALMGRLEKFRFEPQQARQGPIVDQLLGTAMPADAMDLQHVVDDLRELRQDPALQSIGQYQAYQVLSRALGATPDSVATVKDTISWARDFPDRTGKARQEVMATALSVRLAVPATAPPKAGRSGFNWNRDFSDEGGGVWTIESAQNKGTRLPLYYFVVEVRNQLHAPLLGFDFFLVIGDAAAQRVELPPRSYIVCDNSNHAGRESLLAPGADRQMLCELRVAPEPPFSPGDLAKLLQRVRSGELHLAIWTKELNLEVSGNHSLDGLQLRDRGVDAEHLHGPSTKIENSFVQSRAPDVNPKGSLAARTTCEQRGDCEATRIKKLSLFAGFFQDALVILGGMLPGAVVAGLVIALARTRASRKGALTALGFLSVAAFPVAMKMGGSGWGPVVAVLILAYAEAGFWAGVLLGWMALKPSVAKVD
jgi:hypothetical protein